MYQFKKNVLSLFLIFLIFISAFTGCGMITEKTDNGKINVIATTTMLADLAKIIGGDKINLTQLMGPGIDPHLYKASAGDVIKMQNADVVICHGLHLEGKMGDIFLSITNFGKDVICIEEGLKSSYLISNEDNPNIYDPHIWFDVDIWKDCAKYLTQKLCETDYENSKTYTTNLKSYLIQLDELDKYIISRIEEIPPKQRVLITAHDAFRYFGEAYGFTVIGLQGINTDSQASTSDIRELADFISENKIGAVFIESSVPAKNIQALLDAVNARGFDVKIGGELYSDSLGDSSSGCESYILTFKSNIDTIVDALKQGVA